MPKKKKMGRPRTFEREPTIGRALETYWEEGVQPLSVNEICRRAKMSKPTLYREFGNEDGLLEAVLERYFETILLPTTQLLKTGRPYLEVTDAIIEFMTTGVSGERGCLFVKMRGAPTRLGPGTVQRVSEIVDELRAAYEAFFVACQERGDVRADLEPSLAARYLDTQISGGLRMLAEGVAVQDVRAQVRVAFDALIPRRGHVPG